MSATSGTSQRRGPNMVEGALVSQSSGGATASFVAFQYNAASLRRTLTPPLVGGQTHDREELVRSTAPVEEISLDIEIDAINAVEQGQTLAMPSGIAPQLAALELLAYPARSRVTNRQQLLAQGTLEIAPIATPAVSFVWGPKRVLPVRLTSFQVTEEDFDQGLNPIRATVAVSMRVLTYSDFADVAAYDQFVSYQRSLESMAGDLSHDSTGTGGDPSAI